jgi:short subunit dehydrogenase-like uncharacterized protein
MSFLLYGAYGYTGELIARRAKEIGLKPILAGRDDDKLKALAQELDLDCMTFDLSDADALDIALQKVPVVLHTAGPFIHTAWPMMEACIRNKVHYLDITGEIGVFKMAHSLHDRASQAGVMLMPGVGFDVVPSDCIAAKLKRLLPDATHITLAFATLGSGPSRGTAKSMIENLGENGAVRQNGKILRVPLGHKCLYFPAGNKQLFAMTIPWGDVFTAWYTTGIPNIEVYMGVKPSFYRFVRLSRYFGWLLKTNFIRSIARNFVNKGPAGPTSEQRDSTKSYLWGEVKNENGASKQVKMVTPEGYTLTAETSLIVVRKVLDGKHKNGFQTPASVYGEELISEVEGVEINQV